MNQDKTNVTAFPAAVAEADTVEASEATPCREGGEAAVVVEACRAEMDMSGLSNTQASREIGVSTTTLSKWLRGLYEGDVPATSAKVGRWLETRAEARRRDLTPAGLDRHVELGVTQDIGAALGHAQAAGDVVLVHGPSGRGKSWACQRYCAGRSSAWQLQATSAIGSVAGLLHRLGAAIDAGSGHPSALAAETAVIERLKDRGALIVVDEAHHLSVRLLDELRQIRDIAACGLALIGGDELWSKLARSPQCNQIVGRIGIRLPLGRTADTDVGALARAVLGRNPSASELRLLVTAAAGAGGFHALRRLMMRAFVMARADGRQVITATDLKAAAEDGAPC